MNGEASIDLPSKLDCARDLRGRWPKPLANEWRAEYPQLFDDDDLRLAMNQATNHFCEWFLAIHIFRTEGSLSMVEKYLFANHPEKAKRLTSILTNPQLETLRRICQSLEVQPPDLLVYSTRDSGCFWFAEAKGPGDRVSAKQRESHSRIRAELGVAVKVFRIKVAHAG